MHVTLHSKCLNIDQIYILGHPRECKPHGTQHKPPNHLCSWLFLQLTVFYNECCLLTVSFTGNIFSSRSPNLNVLIWCLYTSLYSVPLWERQNFQTLMTNFCRLLETDQFNVRVLKKQVSSFSAMFNTRLIKGQRSHPRSIIAAVLWGLCNFI